MVIIDHEKCAGCGLCVGDCIAENICLADGKAVCKGACMQCGHCVAICPENAVSIPDYDMADVEALRGECAGLDIDQLLFTIKARRSIRNYEDRPVEYEKLAKIIQAGRYTATGVNRQDCRFVVVQAGLKELKKMIWDRIDEILDHPDAFPEERRMAYKNIADKRARNIDYLFRNAPAVIYVAADGAQSACLAAQNMELAAVSQGLGVMYNGYLAGATSMTPEALKWLDLTDKKIGICMLIGYPETAYQRTAPRREADVRWR